MVHYKSAALLLAGTVLLFVAFIGTRKSTPADQSSTPAASLVTAPYPGLPIRLKIPSIQLDAPVEYVGKTDQGDMAVPVGRASVGWYKYGVLPGEIGTAVIDGHVVGPRGEPGVFAGVYRLKSGDTFTIEDTKGQRTVFVVTRTSTYGQASQPPEVFNSSQGTNLNLITCAGDWDSAKHEYMERLVIFAVKSP